MGHFLTWIYWRYYQRKDLISTDLDTHNSLKAKSFVGLFTLCRFNYTIASRTLCSFLHNLVPINGSGSESFSVDISTSSPHPVNYILKAEFVNNFEVRWVGLSAEHVEMIILSSIIKAKLSQLAFSRNRGIIVPN